MNKMGCGCDLGCGCEMGCDCEMGCGCSNEGLGQSKKAKGLNPWWFLVGAGVGVGAWYLFKASMTPKSVPGQTVAAPMPSAVSPSKYANLQAVAVRLDELKTLYRSGHLMPEQAIAECEALIKAANAFAPQEPDRVKEIVSSILAFEAEIEDFIKFKKENPSIPAYVPA